MRRVLLVLATVTAALVVQPSAQTPRQVKVELPSSARSIIPPVAERTKIYVEHTGRDAAGRAFVSGLKGAIRTSKRFSLAESDRDAQVVLIIVSVSPAPNARVASAISLAYVANNEWRSLLGSAARFVGRARAEEMGRQTVTELSAVLTAYEPAAQ